MLIIFFLLCIVLVTSKLEEFPTPMHLRRGQMRLITRPEKLKVRKQVSTHLGFEKGWFCMLIFFVQLCIVLVTSKLDPHPTPMHLCRGQKDFITRPEKFKVEIYISTQVGPEKGWFCMLIIFHLLCIVHVTFITYGSAFAQKG